MRKQPRQQRSRDMVDRILNATAECICDLGLDNITTNHIADAADINVASLYQYFADKDDVLEALLEKISHAATRQVAENLIQRRHQIDERNLYQVTRSGISLILVYLRSNALHLELLKNWQRLPVERTMQHLEAYFIEYCHAYFARHFNQYPIPDLQVRLYVLINSVLLLIVRHLGNPSPTIREDDLIETITQMMVLLIEKRS